MWKKIIESSDLMTYEAKKNDLNVRIECRKVDDSEWKIFKTYYGTHLNYTEEYDAGTDEDKNMVIKQLMDEKPLSQTELKKIKKQRLQVPKIEIKRSYKEDNVEKWFFSVNDGHYNNFFVLREYDSYELDIILDEQYKPMKKKVVEAINEMLSIGDNEMEIERNIYFYKSHSRKHIRPKSNILFSKIQSDFSFDE